MRSLPFAFLGVLLVGTVARAEDAWWAKDKALHFGASAAIAAGGYGMSSFVFKEPGPRLLTGGALALGAGVAVELYDLAGHGDPSWKDLAWDVIGLGAGLFAAWTVDRYVVQPCLAEPAAGTQALRQPPLLRLALGGRF